MIDLERIGGWVVSCTLKAVSYRLSAISRRSAGYGMRDAGCGVGGEEREVVEERRKKKDLEKIDLEMIDGGLRGRKSEVRSGEWLRREERGARCGLRGGRN